MKQQYIHHSKYFYGNKVSDYGLQHGYIDYATLAKSFDCVLANDLITRTNAANLGEWETVNGDERYYTNGDDHITEDEYYNLDDGKQEEYTEEYNDIYQWYIISDNGYEILSRCTNELVYYNEELDLYIWGVTHYGTSWDYVLTDIRIDTKEEE